MVSKLADRTNELTYCTHQLVYCTYQLAYCTHQLGYVLSQFSDVPGKQLHRLRQRFVAFHQSIQTFVDGHALPQLSKLRT